MTFIWLYVSLWWTCVAAFTITLEPRQKLCYYQQLNVKDKFLLGFQTMDGAGLEVDFWVLLSIDIVTDCANHVDYESIGCTRNQRSTINGS